MDLLLDCDSQNRENCTEYCQNFFYTNFTSIFDVDFEKLIKVFQFVKTKMQYFKIKQEISINEDSLKIIHQPLVLEKNQFGIKSVDSQVR